MTNVCSPRRVALLSDDVKRAVGDHVVDLGSEVREGSPEGLEQDLHAFAAVRQAGNLGVIHEVLGEELLADGDIPTCPALLDEASLQQFDRLGHSQPPLVR